MYPPIMVITTPCQNSKRPVLLLTLFPKCNMAGDSCDNGYSLPFYFPRYCFSSVCLSAYKPVWQFTNFNLKVFIYARYIAHIWYHAYFLGRALSHNFHFDHLWLLPNRGTVFHKCVFFFWHVLTFSYSMRQSLRL